MISLQGAKFSGKGIPMNSKIGGETIAKHTFFQKPYSNNDLTENGLVQPASRD
jgi:hypothetical protein